MSVRSVALRGLAWSCAVAAVVLACCAPALAARGHVFSGVFGFQGSGPGQLSEPAGVAVNEATGVVYVADKANDRVEYFSASGTYLGQFDGSGLQVGEGRAAGSGGLPNEVPTGRFSAPEGIAVDNSTSPEDPSAGDVYVVDSGHLVIDKFSSMGVYVGQVSGICPAGETCPPASLAPFGGLFGVGVDTKGELWVYHGEAANGITAEVANFTDAVVNEFIRNRGPLETFTGGSGFAYPGFAVDSTDNFYVHTTRFGEGTDLILKYDREGRVLNGGQEENPIDTEPPTGVAVELSSNDVYIDNATTVGVFSPSGTLVERLGSGRLTTGSGVAVNSASGELYVADSATGVVDVFGLEPPSKPTVETESVSSVSGNSATFEGELNPRGGSTEYRFEYGPCLTPGTCAASAYEKSVPAPDASIGSGFAISNISLHVQELEPHVTYHFRLVAHNEFGVAAGEEQTFTTQTVGGGLTLLDGRAWEMVSPADKQGAQVFAIGQYSGEGAVIQAAADGGAMTYMTDAPTELEPKGYTNLLQVFWTRGSGDWTSQDIAIPHDSATGPSVGQGEEYRFFSEDLSFGVVQPFGVFMPSLSAEASEQTPYLRTDFADGGTGGPPCASSCYRPLVTSAPGHENVPSGIVFGEEGKCPPQLICGPNFLGATPDASHVVIESSAALTSTPTGGVSSLYEWSGGRLALVSERPDGKIASSPTFGYGTAGSGGNARHAISDNGSRVFWSEQSGHLYVRDTVKKKTVRLDMVQGGSGEGSENPIFQIASSDGSKVFFTDPQRLTKDSGSQGNTSDLYECEIVEVAAELECRLSDVTPGGSGGSADVLGVLGASEDGSSVYFVADGVLAPGAVQGKCKGSLEASLCNLYVWHDGEIGLVAVLGGADHPDWAGDLAHMTARVSPDGRWLAFMSQRELTGYDPRDAVSGKSDEEVYLYSAEANAGSGHVTCASCNPTGARPIGAIFAGRDTLPGGDRVWDTPIAANVPAWTPYKGAAALYQSRYLSASGRLFFNSSDALVSQDVNGTEDVYEYEPPGVGDCTSASVSFSPRSGGCVSLVSPGTSSEESGFMDASANGGDVFFLTSAKLASQDGDTAVDIYDAHECTLGSACFAQPPALPPACDTGDSCKAAPAPQPEVFGSPASATFSGSGNMTGSSSKPIVRVKGLTRAQKLGHALKACHRMKGGKRRSDCKRRARARYAAKRSSSNATRKGGR